MTSAEQQEPTKLEGDELEQAFQKSYQYCRRVGKIAVGFAAIGLASVAATAAIVIHHPKHEAGQPQPSVVKQVEAIAGISAGLWGGGGVFVFGGIFGADSLLNAREMRQQHKKGEWQPGIQNPDEVLGMSPPVAEIVISSGVSDVAVPVVIERLPEPPATTGLPEQA